MLTTKTLLCSFLLCISLQSSSSSLCLCSLLILPLLFINYASTFHPLPLSLSSLCSIHARSLSPHRVSSLIEQPTYFSSIHSSFMHTAKVYFSFPNLSNSSSRNSYNSRSCSLLRNKLHIGSWLVKERLMHSHPSISCSIWSAPLDYKRQAFWLSTFLDACFFLNVLFLPRA